MSLQKIFTTKAESAATKSFIKTNVYVICLPFYWLFLPAIYTLHTSYGTTKIVHFFIYILNRKICKYNIWYNKNSTDSMYAM